MSLYVCTGIVRVAICAHDFGSRGSNPARGEILSNLNGTSMHRLEPFNTVEKDVNSQYHPSIHVR